MNKKLVLLGATAILFLALFLSTQLNTSGSGSVSPDILFLTSPVTSFNGTVDNISGNTLTVSQTMTLSQSGAIAGPAAAGQPVANPSPFPTPVSKKITLRVKITDKTAITRSVSMVPYLFKEQSPITNQKLTAADIKAGQTVSVNTAVDLRTGSAGVVEAAAIQLSSLNNNINGEVVSVNNNVITVKGFAPMTGAGPAAGAKPTTPKVVEYRVTVTNETEISRYKYSSATPDPNKPPTTPEKEKLSVSDIKKDMRVTVYTDQDVSTVTNFNALRIEPFDTPVINAAALPAAAVPTVTTPPASAEAEVQNK